MLSIQANFQPIVLIVCVASGKRLTMVLAKLIMGVELKLALPKFVVDSSQLGPLYYITV